MLLLKTSYTILLKDKFKGAGMAGTALVMMLYSAYEIMKETLTKDEEGKKFMDRISVIPNHAWLRSLNPLQEVAVVPETAVYLSLLALNNGSMTDKQYDTWKKGIVTNIGKSAFGMLDSGEKFFSNSGQKEVITKMMLKHGSPATMVESLIERESITVEGEGWEALRNMKNVYYKGRENMDQLASMPPFNEIHKIISAGALPFGIGAIKSDDEIANRKFRVDLFNEWLDRNFIAHAWISQKMKKKDWAKSRYGSDMMSGQVISNYRLKSQMLKRSGQLGKYDIAGNIIAFMNETNYPYSAKDQMIRNWEW